MPHEEEFKALLGVPKEKRLLTLVPIGVPAEWPIKEKKPLEEVLHWESRCFMFGRDEVSSKTLR